MNTLKFNLLYYIRLNYFRLKELDVILLLYMLNNLIPNILNEFD